ncbi:hypothetical protein HN51_022386 [Arachis hypogaea]|uniref:Myb/SANT-like DNA-binding domain-containing protein n=2 Tax=Arachis TaxID=3817 RepID=A0A445ECG2_ARAHY|nr:uncharacterized protein LOC107474774 [Arachis duranensis]XP_025650922.1 uncharacterized protein LOC112747105 [Arachis hypogaea]QHO53599.1 Trihelix transcription factor [Arachis hypogaea]QHO53600.1 Trihelix transcription factor [Arachis hypogaea]QHO53601.1 Trihelix transcription factor [Arachis hypogaea]RYR73216.1 hypothetical protein Ahy_A02g007564 isoform B [Arachis hypogaea]
MASSPTPTPTPTPSSPKLIAPITTITATTTTTTTTNTTNDAVSPTKKPQPIPWTHQETVNLIRAYQEKWYALKRGPLRANQWEEVAVVVAARCGYDFNHPCKSAVQCRHKMEKLRQRHRAEKKQHLLTTSRVPARATWQYYGLMDELERGPMPISARPITSMAPTGGNDEYGNYGSFDQNDDDFIEENEERENYIKSKSINYLLSKKPSMNKCSGILRDRVPKGLWRFDDADYDDDDVNYLDDDDDDDDDDGNCGGGGGDERGVVMVDERALVSGLSTEIKDFTERFIGMENLKMRIVKETERRRLEMENRRMEMILESRQRTIDSIGRVFGSSKRLKMSEGS